MDKITDKINALSKDADYFSLEFFPPKTQMVRCLVAPCGCSANTSTRASPISKTVLSAWRLRCARSS